MTRIVAIQQLIEKGTKKPVELYTSTNYDMYIDKVTKRKYIRNRDDIQLYSDNEFLLSTPLYSSIENKPKTIEEEDDFESRWTCSYIGKIKRDSNSLIIAASSKYLMK